MAKLNRKEIIGYIIQLFTVAIGISIPFLMNEWRENVQEIRTEHQSLSTIYENLAMDTLQLDGQIKNAKIQIGRLEVLLKDNNQALLKDSIDYYLDATISYGLFKATRVGYEEMTQMGNSKLIRNRELRKNVITYYTQVNNYLLEWNSIDKQFVMEQTIPYYQKHFPYAPYRKYKDLYKKSPARIEQALQKDEFKNKVRENSLFKQRSYGLFKLNKKKAKELMEEIKVYLKV